MLFGKLKQWMSDRCPECEQKLISRHDDMALIKHCPDHHYTEETYTQLGVTIVYRPDQEQD
ncbi:MULTISPECIES: hypothetical protein [Paenibacillus]|uniref:Uncharacterized protein n=1 Tax=Paenibacillus campinasensis TaxID=66347 RepID=A0A268EMR7_9BACL|nr:MULTISPECIES: hypothetical protein [Paenibacillus]MUG67007.1 hypothetical protein [Paenibacillus campinasensis]PAD74403.1 hypothetical protein CHH67_17790 [Paenibacillus campinasensis]PAK50799.1 hypothetical protein CHH75_16330 [Paenibacillus sp. 7541]